MKALITQPLCDVSLGRTGFDYNRERLVGVNEPLRCSARSLGRAVSKPNPPIGWGSFHRPPLRMSFHFSARRRSGQVGVPGLCPLFVVCVASGQNNDDRFGFVVGSIHDLRGFQEGSDGVAHGPFKPRVELLVVGLNRVERLHAARDIADNYGCVAHSPKQPECKGPIRWTAVPSSITTFLRRFAFPIFTLFVKKG